MAAEPKAELDSRFRSEGATARPWSDVVTAGEPFSQTRYRFPA